MENVIERRCIQYDENDPENVFVRDNADRPINNENLVLIAHLNNPPNIVIECISIQDIAQMIEANNIAARQQGINIPFRLPYTNINVGNWRPQENRTFIERDGIMIVVDRHQIVNILNLINDGDNQGAVNAINAIIPVAEEEDEVDEDLDENDIVLAPEAQRRLREWNARQDQRPPDRLLFRVRDFQAQEDIDDIILADVNREELRRNIRNMLQQGITHDQFENILEQATFNGDIATRRKYFLTLKLIVELYRMNMVFNDNIENNNVERVRKMMRAGWRGDDNSFSFALFGNNPDMVRTLLENGVIINDNGGAVDDDAGYYTTVFEEGNEDILRLLIRYRVPVARNFISDFANVERRPNFTEMLQILLATEPPLVFVNEDDIDAYAENIIEEEGEDEGDDNLIIVRMLRDYMRRAGEVRRDAREAVVIQPTESEDENLIPRIENDDNLINRFNREDRQRLIQQGIINEAGIINQEWLARVRNEIELNREAFREQIEVLRRAEHNIENEENIIRRNRELLIMNMILENIQNGFDDNQRRRANEDIEDEM